MDSHVTRKHGPMGHHAKVQSRSFDTVANLLLNQSASVASTRHISTPVGSNRSWQISQAWFNVSSTRCHCD
eukprot:1272485-Pleurochrysis_carterae.AAC.1